MRCKGISVTVQSAQTVNADSMRELVKENKMYHVPQRLMRRDKKEGTIRSVNLEKKLRVTFSKRLWPDNIDEPSLPIGWQD